RTSKGILNLIREKISTDYAVFGEPSGVRKITFGYKGRLGFKITCKTETGHVGAQHLLDNAIEKSVDLWSHLKAACEKYKYPSGVFYSLTPSLIAISSRRTSGGLPNVCILTIDMRLPPTIRCGNAIALIQGSLKDFQGANPEASFTLSVTDRVEPFVANRDSLVM
ncbi:MAG: peptidase dimerization domain-containing protein, partial [Nitrososphaerota archaeon]